MNSRTRQGILAGHVSGLHLKRDENRLTALAVGGPSGTEGRGVSILMTDDTIRGILAHLALNARWAAALMVLGLSPRVLAATANLRNFPSTVGERAELTDRMKRAMDTQDAELAVDEAQGTQTRLRQGSHNHPRTPAYPEPVRGCRVCEPDFRNYLSARTELRNGPGGDRPGLSPNQATELLRDARNSPDPVVSLAHGVTVRCTAGTRWQITWHERPQRPVLGIRGLAEATTLDESYGALASLGHAFMRAGEGTTTEVREDDGTVVALITPPGGPS